MKYKIGDKAKMIFFDGYNPTFYPNLSFKAASEIFVTDKIKTIIKEVELLEKLDNNRWIILLPPDLIFPWADKRSDGRQIYKSVSEIALMPIKEKCRLCHIKLDKN